MIGMIQRRNSKTSPNKMCREALVATAVFAGAEDVEDVGLDQIKATTVRLRSAGAVQVVLANGPSFAANLQTLDIAQLGCTPETDSDDRTWEVCDVPDWDLLAEVGDLGDVSYGIYAKFIDRFGYESPIASDTVRLDTRETKPA